MSELRLGFAGTPAFAAGHLQALIDDQFNLVAVYTQPDRPTGRGKKLTPSPVKQLALEHDLPIFQPSSLREPQAQQELAELNLDVLVVVAYGLILPAEILAAPRLGCLNVHASLLPRWRGAAPIERAILEGDQESGVTIMQMDEGLDTGAMLNRASVTIESGDTGPSLEAKLLTIGKESLTATLNNLEQYQSNAQAQDDALANYASKLDKSEAAIDWQDSAEQISRLVRAYVGRMPAYSLLDSERVRILEAESVLPELNTDNTFPNAEPGTIIASNDAQSRNDKSRITVACGEGVLQISRLQLAGKNPVAVRDLLNSRAELIAPGKRFSSQLQ